MGSFYTPDIPYNLNTFLDNLGAYSLTPDLYESLQMCREMTASGKYFFQGVPFPTGQNTYIDGYDTYSGNLTVPPLAFLIAIAGDCFYTAGELKGLRSLEGFKFRLYDKGAMLDTVINSLYAQNLPNMGNMSVIGNMGSPGPTNTPVGPMFLEAPLVILHPGSLQIELTNLSATNCYVQLLMHLCVPINRQSANEQIMISGNNNRGGANG